MVNTLCFMLIFFLFKIHIVFNVCQPFCVLSSLSQLLCTPIRRKREFRLFCFFCIKESRIVLVSKNNKKPYSIFSVSILHNTKLYTWQNTSSFHLHLLILFMYNENTIHVKRKSIYLILMKSIFEKRFYNYYISYVHNHIIHNKKVLRINWSHACRNEFSTVERFHRLAQKQFATLKN